MGGSPSIHDLTPKTYREGLPSLHYGQAIFARDARMQSWVAMLPPLSNPVPPLRYGRGPASLPARLAKPNHPPIFDHQSTISTPKTDREGLPTLRYSQAIFARDARVKLWVAKLPPLSNPVPPLRYGRGSSSLPVRLGKKTIHQSSIINPLSPPKKRTGRDSNPR